MQIRPAVPSEAAALAKLHRDVRHATYAKILPAAVLAADTYAKRLALWEARVADPARRIFVAELDGRLLGLACAAPMPAFPNGRAPLPGFDAYLESLYVDPGAHKHGVGAALLRTVAAAMREAGATSLALHTLSRNTARGFYERMGARFVREERVEQDGEHWFHAAYGWDDIDAVAG
jgi:GNAT superfamily N-acetyltransferase